jgi:anaerobic selenocysteine-containing dehydrogenase
VGTQRGRAALQRARGWVDHDYVERCTVGFADLEKMVADYPPQRVAEICGLTEAEIRAAAELLGSAKRLLCTVLQGFYQSHQAAAASVQVNNVNLIRGMLGEPGAGVLQMNGRPTAENTRECGADGDLTGFRNWANDDHVAELAELSEKAVEPPGQARPDLDILLEYARRMDFRDQDGALLPQWHDAESAFEAWKRASAGRPCDYSGLSYAKLRTTSGVQWPCTEEHPDGTERLYTDGKFFAQPGYCESYGRDLVTGAPMEPGEYRAMNPDGKAMIKAAEYLEPHEAPSDDHPFALITGRTIHHFHTRTKTARAPQLKILSPQVLAS